MSVQPPLPPAEELLRLNRMLDEQVKTLVKTEQRLFVSQRDLARRNRRLDALTAFAVHAAELEEPRQTLAVAIDAVCSVFAIEQAIGFLSPRPGALQLMIARDADRGDLPVEAELLHSVIAALPCEPIVDVLENLRRRGLGPLLDCCDRAFGERAAERALGVVIPLHPRGNEPAGALLFRRVDTAITYHEEAPGPADVPYLSLVARLVAAHVSNAQLLRDLRVSYERLARAQQDLVERERLAALGEFAAIVAHEVRNPLAVIFNVTSMLRRHLESPEAKNLHAILDEESERLNRIVSDLIDFARPHPPSLRPHKVARIIEGAVDSVRASVPNARVRVELPSEDPTVLADERKLRQAMLNLIVNAVQATPDQTVTVRVVVRGGFAVLVVEDHGPGVTPEVRARIFEPFFTTKPDGTGLGLSVVKRVAESHGGHVEVGQSEAGGAAFSLFIPIVT